MCIKNRSMYYVLIINLCIMYAKNKSVLCILKIDL